jgi:DNA-binding response OmpR family regulator
MEPPPPPYTFCMATIPTPVQRQVALLVLENEPQNSAALKQILDSEGWRVRIVEDVPMLHVELKTTEYSLLIANIALIGVKSATFHVLRELAGVSAQDGGLIRVLYVVPEYGGAQYVSDLEAAHLPYVVRPFHLHDFLEKVSDLLVEVKAITGPMRMTRHEFGATLKQKKKSAQSNSMFASRDSYFYSEEDIAEYEKAEAESSRTRRKGPLRNLGNPRG